MLFGDHHLLIKFYVSYIIIFIKEVLQSFCQFVHKINMKIQEFLASIAILFSGI